MIFSKKQQTTFDYIEKELKRLIKDDIKFKLAVIGHTGFKHVLNLLEDKYGKASADKFIDK